jgi:hypothetical protein
VLSAGGAWLRVGAATWVQGRRTVYNLEVEGWHTYVVGQLGAWVHNACGKESLLKMAENVQQAGKIPRRWQTVSVLETAEGQTLVGAGRRDLNAAQKELAQKLGLRVTELSGAHAEETVLNAAGQLGLTPTVGAATNNVCPGVCQPLIVDTLKGWVSGKFYGF